MEKEFICKKCKKELEQIATHWNSYVLVCAKCNRALLLNGNDEVIKESKWKEKNLI